MFKESLPTKGTLLLELFGSVQNTGSYSVSNRVIKSASPSFKSENDSVSFFHLLLPPLWDGE